MNIAARYPGRLSTLIGLARDAAVGVQDYAERSRAKRKPGIACHIYESLAVRGGPLKTEP